MWNLAKIKIETKNNPKEHWFGVMKEELLELRSNEVKSENPLERYTVL